MTRAFLLTLVTLAGCGTDGPKSECDESFKIDVWDDADEDGAGDPATAARACSLGDGQVTNDEDCDDGNPDISPFSPELCDNIDQDCSGVPDDGLFGGTWYLDGDGDGFGDPDAPVTGCQQPPDTTLDATDCDDVHADAYPGAPEVCDTYDNNCDTLIDDQDPTVDRTTGTFFYVDADGDTFGNDEAGQQSCLNPNPQELTEVGGDCDDTEAARNPSENEVCDNIDNNCDGLTDDEDPLLDLATADTFYEDLDEDSYGNDLVQTLACEPGAGAALVGGDCNDNEPLLHDPVNWVNDLDNDGIGAGAILGGGATCIAPGPNTSPEPAEDDCNDGDPAIYPGAVEICGDLVDSDCDGDDCSDWDEDFEAGPPFPVEFTFSGNANWVIDGAKAHAGAYSAASGNIGDNQTSKTQIVLDYPAGGTISFWHSGVTESCCDFLKFYIDGALLLNQGGNWNWQFAQYNVNPGVHTLKWEYYKDVSISVAPDTVWIDDAVAIGGAP